MLKLHLECKAVVKETISRKSSGSTFHVDFKVGWDRLIHRLNKFDYFHFISDLLTLHQAVENLSVK